MRIALIGPAHPLRGGLSFFNERLAKALQDQGHEVTIFSFSLQYPSFLFPGTTQYSDEPAPAGINIRTIINSVNPLNWITSGIALKNYKADLVIIRYWLPFMGPCLGTILRIAKSRKTKMLCIADNVIPHEKRPGDKPFTQYFVKSIDAFITMSKIVLNDLKKFTDAPARFTTHPLYDNYGEAVGQQEARKKLGLDPSGRYMLFFGFIRKYKGLDILLEAISTPGIKASGIQLIIAGEFYDDRKGYDEIIEKHNLKGHVKLFTDFIPNSEVKYYFSAADVVVQPYRSATQSGITQVAYQFERPMIVTNVGGLAEVVVDGKTGFITEPEPDRIAATILKFFQPDSLPDMETHLKAEKKKYSWNTFTEVLLATAFGRSE